MIWYVVIALFNGIVIGWFGCKLFDDISYHKIEPPTNNETFINKLSDEKVEKLNKKLEQF